MVEVTQMFLQYTTGKLLAILKDPPKCRKLKMELSVTVDAMEPFVKATYALEGDGPIALTAYEQISTLYSHISTAYYPNVNAWARHQSSQKEYLHVSNNCWPMLNSV